MRTASYRMPPTPIVKGHGQGVGTGTTWASPTWICAGDLIVATRGSTGGGVEGMGTDFTLIVSEGTDAYDINCGWTIATANGSTTYTIPSGGTWVFYVVIRAGTFNPRNPCPTAFAAGALVDHNNAAWPVLRPGSRHLCVQCTYSGTAVIPARIPGSTPLWSNTGSNPYTRGFAKLGGWPAVDLTNTSEPTGANGTAGQVCKTWSFAVAPRI